ncbi:MAG TPA: sugar ABC transporter substrate-binding protein [Pseudonocardiaceae bacterium]|nr:sugar ABC transporter substrate-binding protein [Pseudonocardiaceae bacterium]
MSPHPRFRSLMVLGTLGLAVLSVGCGTAAGSSAPGSTGPGGLRTKTIDLVGYGSANPWGAYFNQVYHQQLAASGAKINDLTTMDPGTQVQDFNQALSGKPDLIVLAVLDTKAVVVPIEKAKQAGVPVLVVDGRPDPSVASDVMSVLSDNVKLGEFAAQNIIDGLKSQGRATGNVIVLTGTKAMLVTQDRMQGFDKTMATAPQYKVVNEQDANWDPALSGQIAQQLMARYGCSGVQAAYGMADYMALPIVQAAKQAGCAIGGRNGLIVTSSNCFKAGIESIQAGQLYGSATEDPVTIARQTADYTVKFLAGQHPPRSETVTEQRITAANVGQLAAQCSHV